MVWLFLFSLVIGIQLFYYLYYFSRLAFYKKKDKQKSQEFPVSVVICAKNEAANLAQHLPGVLLQQYRTTHEIIVVNDNSEDESKYILEEYQRKFKNLSTLNLTQEAVHIPGKKYPLSMGIMSAKYGTLLLTDADCIPASEFWMQKMQDGYAPGIDIVLGYGRYQRRPGLLNKMIRFETFFTAMQYLSFALAGQAYMGVGRNMSYKRELFIKNKGFSSINHIPGGDDDLFINKVANKHNTAIVIDPEAHTISEPKNTWAEWQRQKARHYTTGKYYKPKFKFLLGLFSASHVLLYPLMLLSCLRGALWPTLVLFFVRTLSVALIWRKVMRQLKEEDLWPMLLFWDVWIFIYYLFYAPALIMRPAKTWK